MRKSTLLQRSCQSSQVAAALNGAQHRTTQLPNAIEPLPHSNSVRHQSLKKLTKREVLEKSHADLATARCGEEEARFELARKLTEVGAFVGAGATTS
jgi:hypothetical protein